jgi:hypothetical protein
MSRRVAAFPAVIVAVVAAAGCGSSHSKSARSPTAGTSSSSPPSIRAGDFIARVDNPYFPLPPGRTFRYRGTKDGKPSVDVFSVTRETTRMMGVPVVVVHDSLYLAGKLGE